MDKNTIKKMAVSQVKKMIRLGGDLDVDTIGMYIAEHCELVENDDLAWAWEYSQWAIDGVKTVYIDDPRFDKKPLTIKAYCSPTRLFFDGELLFKFDFPESKNPHYAAPIDFGKGLVMLDVTCYIETKRQAKRAIYGV
jgi:hypothetical protein